MNEEWRAIPAWEGIFEVSNYGRVRSLDRVLADANGQLRRYKGRIRVVCRAANGYLLVALTATGRAREWPHIHTLVLRAFVGEPAEGMQACHFDGNRHNNRLSNLRWDTAKANAEDKRRHNAERKRLRDLLHAITQGTQLPLFQQESHEFI